MTGAPAPAVGEDGGSAGGQRLRRRRPDVPRGAVTADDGVLLVDKPAGLSSHDVVALVRRMGATRKVGHAGTLDPMATGLLLVGLGRATRLLTHLVGADKTYEATIRLGQETVTEDAEGKVLSAWGCPAPEHWDGGREGFEARLAQALSSCTGPIMQVPSAVSALKVDGVRSYARVRHGEQVELEARAVRIDELAVHGEPRVGMTPEGTAVVDLDMRVSCSSGTYVRALARDIGRSLGTGAHLTALRRTRVGPFDVSEARTVPALAAAVSAAAAREPAGGLAVTAVSEVARRCFPALELVATEARALRHGQRLAGAVLERAGQPNGARARFHEEDGEHAPGPVTAAFAPDGTVVALLTLKGGSARPVLVLAPA